MKDKELKLKLALAKMLPQRLREGFYSVLTWKDSEDCYDKPRAVYDTELLHVCWLIEQTLNKKEMSEHNQTLCKIVVTLDKLFPPFKADNYVIHASWQQKTEALAKVKEVEI